MIKYSFAVASLLAVVRVAPAGELKDKQFWDGVDRVMKTEGDELKKKCGKDIPISIDKKSFQNAIFPSIGPKACSVMLTAVAGKCDSSNPDRNKVVLKQIKKLSCKYGGPLKDSVKKAMKEAEATGSKFDVKGSEQQLSLKKDTFQWVLHYDKDTEYLVFTRGDDLYGDLFRFLDDKL